MTKRNKIIFIAMSAVFVALIITLVVVLVQGNKPKVEKQAEAQPITEEAEMSGYIYPDFDKFNSPAEENGLGDTKIYIHGKCTSIEDINGTVFIVVVDNGHEWLVSLFSSEYDTGKDFSILVGEELYVFGSYLGFSEIVKMPALFYETILCNGKSYSFEDHIKDYLLLETEKYSSVDIDEPEQTATPVPAPTNTPAPSPTQSADDSEEQILALIREYAQQEWPDDSSMENWEYKQQVNAYEYCKSLPESDIKSYSLKEWQEGKYTIWTMVEWEYKQQLSAYNYMKDIEWSGKQAAISYWTEGGYVIWTMVQWEYENR